MRQNKAICRGGCPFMFLLHRALSLVLHIHKLQRKYCGNTCLIVFKIFNVKIYLLQVYEGEMARCLQCLHPQWHAPEQYLGCVVQLQVMTGRQSVFVAYNTVRNRGCSLTTHVSKKKTIENTGICQDFLALTGSSEVLQIHEHCRG